MKGDRWATGFRLRLVGAALSFLYQSLPVTVRSSGFLYSSLAAVARCGEFAALTAGLGGSVHALAGATQLVTNPESPRAVLGTPFTLVFAIVGAPSDPGSYEIRGALPPGMAIPGLVGDLLNGFSGSLAGTPSAAGQYTLNFRAWLSANKQGKGGDFVYALPLLVVAQPNVTLQPFSRTSRPGDRVE